MDTQNLNPLQSEPNIGQLMVIPSYKCQMACRYCFIDRDRPDMSEAVLKRCVELLFTSPFKEVQLQFFGGEPLLRFDLIKKAIRYADQKARQKNKSIKYLITTNGLLLDKEKLGYFKKHKVCVMVSLDGAKITQKKNRPLADKKCPEYFNILIGNLKNLMREKMDYFVNLTFLPDNLPGLKTNVRYLVGLGVKDIQLSEAIGSSFDEDDLLVYVGLLKEMIKFTEKNKVKLRNVYNNVEDPCFASPQINVGTSGDIYLGCAFILERFFPDLVKLFRAGNVSKVNNISLLEKTKEDQVAYFIKIKDKLNPRLLHNLYFGVGLYAFFMNCKLRSKYASLPRRLEGGRVSSYLYCDTLALMLPDMSEAVLKRCVELLFTSPFKEVQLQFFGGEPLLRFDLIKKAIRYADQKARQKNKSIKYLITTNGLLLDKEKLGYFKKHKVRIRLEARGRTAGAVVRALRLLSRQGCDFSVNIITSPSDIAGLPEKSALFFREGAKKIRFSCELGVDWPDQDISNYFMRLFKAIEKMGGKAGARIINKGSLDEPCLISPVLSVDHDGKIYCGCVMSLDRKFRALRGVNMVGDVKINRSMEEIKRDKNDQLAAALKAYPRVSSAGKAILSNIVLGELSYYFFNGLLKEACEPAYE